MMGMPRQIGGSGEVALGHSERGGHVVRPGFGAIWYLQKSKHTTDYSQVPFIQFTPFTPISSRIFASIINISHKVIRVTRQNHPESYTASETPSPMPVT